MLIDPSSSRWTLVRCRLESSVACHAVKPLPPRPAQHRLQSIANRPRWPGSHGYDYALTSAAGIAAHRPADRTRSPRSSCHWHAEPSNELRGPERSSADVAFAAGFPGLLRNTAGRQASCSRAILPGARAPKAADNRTAPGWPPSLEAVREARPADYACSGKGWTFGKTRAPDRLDGRLSRRHLYLPH